METISLALYVVLAAVSAAVYYFNKHLNYWERHNIPHIEARSVLGIFSELRKNTGRYELFRNVYHKYKGVGPFVGIYVHSLPYVVLLDCDLIKNVLIKDFNNFDDRGMFYNERDDPLTAHILALDPPKWRPLRGKLTSTFTSGKMKYMFPTLVSVGEQLIEAFDREAKINSDIDVRDLLVRFTTDVIGTCAFGIECNSLKNPNVVFRKMGKRIFANPPSLMYKFLTEMYPKLARFLRLKRIPDDVTEFFTKLVTDTVEYRERSGVRRNDFMDLLIDLKNNKSDLSKNGQEMTTLAMSEIIAQSFIFFVAGFETSSTALGFSLYELARNPDIQNKLRREINDVLSRHNDKLAYDVIKEMPYLQKVISESLRLHPPALQAGRIANNDYPTNDPKFTIPKNSHVIVPILGIHSDPELYPNPKVFDPERFSPEEIKKRHPMAWIPFGDGPRNCIGLRFAKLEVQIALVLLMKNFKFSVTKDTPIPMTYDKRKTLLSSEKPIVLRVERI